MNRKIILSFCLGWVSLTTIAQQPVVRPVRIADSLSAKEKSERNPVLLRSELDSLIAVYAPVKTENQAVTKPMEKKDHAATYNLAGLAAILLITGWMLLLLYRQRKQLLRLAQSEETNQPGLPEEGKSKNSKKKVTTLSLQEKIGELDAELIKLSKENEGLNRVISEYNGIRHEYNSLKHGMYKTYKIKNYPGYDKTRDDSLTMQGVLDTENAVAGYAYEKFLKPVLAIADTNKNSPSKISTADREKLLDLLVSLSLLYIEYLYLRVSDLSVGGNMVERIKAFANGNQPDPALLKKLSTESGSRALVIRLALSKASVSHLSYPVFDETNLNNE